MTRRGHHFFNASLICLAGLNIHNEFMTSLMIFKWGSFTWRSIKTLVHAEFSIEFGPEYTPGAGVSIVYGNQIARDSRAISGKLDVV